jgi:glucose uptake protein GlcU
MKILQPISISIFFICLCCAESNVLFGVIALLFLLVFFLLTKLEETKHEREKSHKQYVNRKHLRDDGITYATYDRRRNEHFAE